MDCTHQTTRRRTPEDSNLNILYMSRDTATLLPRNASRWHVSHCDSIMLTAIFPILPGGCSLMNEPTGVWVKATSTLDNAKRTTSFRDTRPWLWHWWHNFPINRLQIFSHTLREVHELNPQTAERRGSVTPNATIHVMLPCQLANPGKASCPRRLAPSWSLWQSKILHSNAWRRLPFSAMLRAVSWQSAAREAWHFKMGLTYCPETSLTKQPTYAA